MFIAKKILFIALLLLSNFTMQAQDDVDGITAIDIDEAIKLKSDDKKQQTMLIDFKKKYKNSNHITVEEKNDHYELIVENKNNDGFTGGAEGYTLDKINGEIKMIWHEHPMKIQNQKN